MTEAQLPAGHAPDGGFLLWREVDRLDRRIDTERDRISRLDEHGSRGVDGLRAEVRQLREDMTAHEALHERATAAATRTRQWVIGVLVAVVVPLYPLLLFRHGG